METGFWIPVKAGPAFWTIKTKTQRSEGPEGESRKRGTLWIFYFGRGRFKFHKNGLLGQLETARIGFATRTAALTGHEIPD